MIQSKVKPKTIFLDFDGTVIDVSARHYEVYRAVIKKYTSKNILSKNRYWEKRCSGMSFVKVIQETHKLSDDSYSERRYIELIEMPRFLNLDRKFKGVKSVLKRLKAHGNVVLVTLRHNRKNLNRQLKQVGLDRAFDQVLSDTGGGFGAKETKQKLIENSPFKSEIKYIVGDTEVDIESGRAAGCITIAVCSGMRQREYLNSFSPDHIIDSILELPDVIRCM